MSGQIVVVALVSPAPGKEARAEEVLKDMVSKIQAKEPNTLRYHLHKAIESTDFVLVETYKSKADFDAHKAAEDFQNLLKTATEEELVSKPPVIVPCESLFGFESR